MSIANIIDFASNVDLSDIEEIFKRQVEYNTAISKQGLTNQYGANLGSTLIRSGNASFGSRVKGKVAAASGAGFEFGLDEGLLGENAEETISNVCYVGKNGMSETDVNVLKIMTCEIDTMLYN